MNMNEEDTITSESKAIESVHSTTNDDGNSNENFQNENTSSVSESSDDEEEDENRTNIDTLNESTSDSCNGDISMQPSCIKDLNKWKNADLSIWPSSLGSLLKSSPAEDKVQVNDKIEARRSIHVENQLSEKGLRKYLNYFSSVLYKYIWIWILLFSLPVITRFPIFGNSWTSVINNQGSLRQKIFENYPSQKKENLKNIFNAIDDVNNDTVKTHTAVITVLYSHRETAEYLANDFAEYSAQIFHKSEQFHKLNGSMIDGNFNLACNDFKDEITKKSVLVVYNFHDIPAEQVKLFHAICDDYSPFVKSKAVYIILLNTGQSQEHISKLLEKLNSRIHELWPGLESNVLAPLITRLSGNIIDVKQENRLQD